MLRDLQEEMDPSAAMTVDTIIAAKSAWEVQNKMNRKQTESLLELAQHLQRRQAACVQAAQEGLPVPNIGTPLNWAHHPGSSVIFIDL